MAWQAYGQFCRHFLATLSLMSYIDVSLGKLLIIHLDGVPIPLASKLLPLKTKFNFGLYLHIHLHGKKQVETQDKKVNTSLKLSKKSVENLAQSLYDTISGLKYQPAGTEWSEYYDKDVQDNYLKYKKESIHTLLKTISSKIVLDLGRIAAEYAHTVYSMDIDPACVEQNYLALKKEKSLTITPLLIDAANPEPAIGWANKERPAIWKRVTPDTIMALAIIHHLCISNNTPLGYLSKFFAKHCEHLIIEWVDKKDEKVQRLLQNRVDIFPDYNEKAFVEAFEIYFDLVSSTPVQSMPTRTMYHFKKST
jgi:hypothetical protein